MGIPIWQLVRKVRDSEIIKNIATLAAGTAFAQLIPILLQPLLRRYYPPESYGAFTVYLSITGILLGITSLKYEMAIILPKRDKHSGNLFFIAILISFLFNCLVFISICIFKSNIQVLLNLPEQYGASLYLIPLGTFLYSYYQSANYWLIRKKRFLAISKNKLMRRGFEGGTQVGFKFLPTVYGLFWGDIIGHIANVVSVSYQCLQGGLKLSMFSTANIRYLIRKYIDYPKFNVLPSLMSAFSYLLPAILINKFYGAANAGYFDLTKLVLSIPFALIATSIANVLLQRVSEKYKSGQRFIKDLLPIAGFVLFIGVIEIVTIRAFGKVLFVWFFGEMWELSGQISAILVWSFAFNFVVGSFSSIYIAMGKIRIYSLWQLIYFIAILGLFFVKTHPFIGFLRVYVWIEVFCYTLFVLFLLFIIMNYERKKVRAAASPEG